MASDSPRPKAGRTALQRRQASNKYMGHFIPCMLVAIVIYASYALIGQVVVDYYLFPSDDQSSIGAGVPILVVYIILLLVFALSYLRLVSTSLLRRRDPDDYSPKYEDAPPGTYLSFMADRTLPQLTLPDFCLTTAQRDRLKPSLDEDVEKSDGPGQYLSVLDYESILSGSVDPPPGLDEYYARDVFRCDPKGLPRWCGKCNTWKPDRAHHSDDVGRCVANFDHFCPWVGGAVAEGNYKFFVQFTFYTVLYTAFIIIVVGCTLSNRAKHHPSRALNPEHIVLLGLAGFFFTFTFGMLCTCIFHMTRNTTTVDAIDASNRTMHLAVRVPQDFDGQFPPPYTPTPPGAGDMTSAPRIPIWQDVITFPIVSTDPASSRLPAAPGPRHTFAIFQTPRGMNPWDLGVSSNLRQIMGRKWYDWVLPIKASPNSEHGATSMYPLGSPFERMRHDVFEGRIS